MSETETKLEKYLRESINIYGHDVIAPKSYHDIEQRLLIALPTIDKDIAIIDDYKLFLSDDISSETLYKIISILLDHLNKDSKLDLIAFLKEQKVLFAIAKYGTGAELALIISLGGKYPNIREAVRESLASGNTETSELLIKHVNKLGLLRYALNGLYDFSREIKNSEEDKIALFLELADVVWNNMKLDYIVGPMTDIMNALTDYYISHHPELYQAILTLYNAGYTNFNIFKGRWSDDELKELAQSDLDLVELKLVSKDEMEKINKYKEDLITEYLPFRLSKIAVGY